MWVPRDSGGAHLNSKFKIQNSKLTAGESKKEITGILPWGAQVNCDGVAQTICEADCLGAAGTRGRIFDSSPETGDHLARRD